MSPRWKKVLVYPTVIFWLAALLIALWWFQGRYLRAFDDRAVVFAGENLQLPDIARDSGRITLVHFWDPACPCNVGNQVHLAELMKNYGPRGVDFLVLQKPGSSGRLPDTLSALQPLTGLPGTEQLPSSPAVAIWSRDGTLAYFGPYSAGLTCTSSNSFIEPVIEALLAGRAVNNSNTLAVGCFCDWQPAP
jgi:hypothetical protein